MRDDPGPSYPPVFCDRCSAELRPGEGNSYVVRIEAFADPAPPILADPVVPPDIGAEIRRLNEQAAGLSEQEAMDQVYRRVILFLCVPCYRGWIERPVG